MYVQIYLNTNESQKLDLYSGGRSIQNLYKSSNSMHKKVQKYYQQNVLIMQNSLLIEFSIYYVVRLLLMMHTASTTTGIDYHIWKIFPNFHGEFMKLLHLSDVEIIPHGQWELWLFCVCIYSAVMRCCSPLSLWFSSSSFWLWCSSVFPLWRQWISNSLTASAGSETAFSKTEPNLN